MSNTCLGRPRFYHPSRHGYASLFSTIDNIVHVTTLNSGMKKEELAPNVSKQCDLYVQFALFWCRYFSRIA